MPIHFSKPPESICILRLSAIGDVTHVLPVVRTLQHHWPRTRITWIIGQLEASLVGDIPGIEFISFEKKGGLSSYRQLHRQLAGRRFDVLFNMQVSLRAGLASLAINAPVKLGYDRERSRNGHGLFINNRISSFPRQHVLDAFLEFPRALGLSETVLKWDIPVPEEARRKAAEWLPAGQSILAINPSSSIRARNWRNWQAASYARIIDYAADRYGMQTVLTGGPSEQEKGFAQEILSQVRTGVLNLVGGTTLKELLAVLDRAHAVIAPDTGPAHMANAVGTPVIGLYATSNPERTGPYLFRALTVNKYSEAVRREFNREVEEIRWGRRVRRPDAMSLITVEEVKAKLDQVMTGHSATMGPPGAQ